jgi:hypothetical protein
MSAREEDKKSFGERRNRIPFILRHETLINFCVSLARFWRRDEKLPRISRHGTVNSLNSPLGFAMRK